MAGLDHSGISRRKLLVRGGGAAAAALTARLMASPFGSPFAPSQHPGPPTYAQFASQVGARFDLRSKGVVVPVRLVEATPRSPRHQGGQPTTGEAFSLLFGDAPSGATLNGTYAVRHRTLGSFSLFVGPVNDPAAGHFEAVVNRSSAAR